MADLTDEKRINTYGAAEYPCAKIGKQRKCRRFMLDGWAESDMI